MKLEHLTEEWGKWVSTRPEVIQKLCTEFPPDRYYLLKSTDQIISIYSYLEDGTLTVDISNEQNPHIIMNRQVFGIKPEDLEEIKQPKG